MTEPIVLRNDVPMLERLLAVLFVAVGGPLTYLGWTEPEQLPDLVVPVVQVGLPLFLAAVVRWVFVQRHRLVVILQPGDPYGSLVLRLGGAEDVVAAEGADIEALEAQRNAVLEWLEAGR